MAVGILSYGFFTFFGPVDAFCADRDFELYGVLDALRPPREAFTGYTVYFISTVMAIAMASLVRKDCSTGFQLD